MPAKKTGKKKQSHNQGTLHRLGQQSWVRFGAPAVFVLVFVILGAVYLTNGHAASYSAVCDYYETSLHCMNDNGGKTNSNNPVIAYRYETTDNHDNFSMRRMTSMCNGGRVAGTCPFTVGDGLNNRYLNDEIVEFQYANASNECVGWSSTNGGATALQPCGSTNGAGSGRGSVFVLNVSGGGGTPGFVENVLDSNDGRYNSPPWLCYFNGNVIGASTSNFSNGSCQWEQTY